MGAPDIDPFRWQAALLVFMVLFAWWNSLDSSFHFDDWSLFNDTHVAGTGLGLGVFRLGQTRPLTFWTFHLNHLAGGTDPTGYHAVNIALHAVNVLLVLWITRRHLAALAAFIAAALFALHPLQTEAVTYIFARSSLLATLFAILCFVLFLRKRFAWSALAFLLSLLAKEETVALPAFLLAYDYLFLSQRSGRALLARKWYYAALLAGAALAAARLFYVLQALPDPGVGFQVKGVTVGSYALTQTRVVWRYLRLVALPAGLNLDHDFRLSTSLLSPPSTLFAALALAALLSALAYLLWRGQAWPFWALGFFLLLAPSSSIVAQADVTFEHRTYFPMMSLVVALGWLAGTALARVPWPGARLGIVAALVVACAAGVARRNEVWATERTLWSDVVSKSPNKGRPYIGLARGFFEENQPGAAREALERGLRNEPNNTELLTNLGVTSLQAGEAREALNRFRRAIELSRETPEAWNNVGAAHHQLGEREEAIAAYRRALRLDACFYNARFNWILLLSEAGRNKEALEAASVPTECRLLPQQKEQLEELRKKLGAVAPSR